MKLRRLSLIAFGPFAGTTLDLDGPSGVLHVVYGPNEAGKSTTLRSLSGLFFGIPERTEDAHRHAPSELRVGAEIETGDGRVLSVVRKKGRKGTLLDAEGNVADDALMTSALVGTTSDLFKTMFGLDHGTLRESAENLLRGKGHAGESLFAAGAGARDVRALRERLRAESERLFTPRGRDQRTLTKLIAEVREARSRVDEASTGAQGYLAQERAVEEARKDRERLAGERLLLVTERARIERLLDILPHLRREQDISDQLAALGHAVRLDADAPERRRRITKRLEETRRAREAAEAELQALTVRLTELGSEPAIAALDEGVILELRESRGRHVSAEKDAPKLEGRLKELVEALRRAVVGVDPGLSLEDVGRLRIGASHAARIRKLSDERRALDAEAAHIEREISARREKRAALASKLWPGAEVLAADPASASSVPSVETVDRMLSELVRAESRLADAALASSRTKESADTVEREIRAVGEAFAVPSEQDLGRARDARDTAIRDRLESKAPADDAALWAAIGLADEVADRLRREADRVYKFAALNAEHVALRVEEQRLAERLHAEEIAETKLRDEWQRLWERSGAPVRSPAEMRPLSERFARLLEIDAERAHLEGEQRRIEEAVALWDGAWRRAIEPLPLREGASIEEAAAVLQATSELLQKAESVDQMKQRLAGIRRDSGEFAEETERLAERFLPGHVAVSHAATAELLISSHRQALSDKAERVRIAKEIQERTRELRKLETEHEEAETRLAELFARASVTTLVELEDAERKSEMARSLSAERERARKELYRLGDGASLETLSAETRHFDADGARARRQELSEEIERIDAGIQEAISQVVKLEAGLPKLEQGAQDPALVLADRVAALKRETHRYLRVRLASLVLEREIERYREANQGPILARATELLPKLTLGNYTGLRVGYGEHDEAASLLCVRRDGTSVGVEALSDGTRDALYLALRLASLERYVGANEPMPLVLDDILIQLDDDRARAALSVLSEVSSLTQVLFFTHHARLVELARGAISPDKLRIHTLPAA